MLCDYCGADNPVGNTACRACGATLRRAGPVGVALPSGTTLLGGAYTIGKVLGQGGFGITYLGTDVYLGRAVAIKEFFPPGAARLGETVQTTGVMTPAAFVAARTSFLAEARTLAQFTTPGIVQVYACFEDHNTAYMVMEFLKGTSLIDLVDRKGPLPEAEAVGYIREVGVALTRVHDAGLLHRDLKPDNIMCTDTGRTVLIDFGTAREFAGDQTRRMTAIVTPGYAPLEQYGGRARFGRYTDIYALGATLYHLLTGEVPVVATDRAAGVGLRPPREVAPTVSPTVNDAVLWAMEVRAADRPQTIAAFIEALDQTRNTSLPAPTPPNEAANSRRGKPEPLVVEPDGTGTYRTLSDAIAGAGDGATIHIRQGTHVLRQGIHVTRSVRPIGEGIDKTRVLYASTDLADDTGESVLRYQGDGLFVLTDLSMRGSNVAHIISAGTGEVQIERCHLQGDQLTASAASIVSVYGNVHGNVAQCRIEGVGTGSGISLGDAATLSLIDNTISCTGGSGIIYGGTSTGLCQGNTCESNGSFGILLCDAASPALERNICRKNTRCGIVYIESAAGVAQRNICRKNMQHGIVVSEQAHPSLEENTCEENSWCGIAYLGSTTGVAQRNICRKNTQRGIYVGGQAHPSLEENTCEENSWSGIAYDESAAGVAQRNICRKNTRHGIGVGGQARPRLTGSTCEENSLDGIAYFESAAGVAQRNICRKNTRHGIVVWGQAQPSLKENTCKENSLGGIAYMENAAGVARRNIRRTLASLFKG